MKQDANEKRKNSSNGNNCRRRQVLVNKIEA